jgi:hypothetical protein
MITRLSDTSITIDSATHAIYSSSWAQLQIPWPRTQQLRHVRKRSIGAFVQVGSQSKGKMDAGNAGEQWNQVSPGDVDAAAEVRDGSLKLDSRVLRGHGGEGSDGEFGHICTNTVDGLVEVDLPRASGSV